MATQPRNAAPTEEPVESPEGTATETLSPAEEERLTDKIVGKVRQLIDEVKTATGRPPAGDDEGGDGSEEVAQPPEPSTSREIEAASEDAVRAAVERIAAEKEHAAEHAKIKELERPPQQFSRLTRALWGDGE